VGQSLYYYIGTDPRGASAPAVPRLRAGARRGQFRRRLLPPCARAGCWRNPAGRVQTQPAGAEDLSSESRTPTAAPCPSRRPPAPAGRRPRPPPAIAFQPREQPHILLQRQPVRVSRKRWSASLAFPPLPPLRNSELTIDSRSRNMWLLASGSAGLKPHTMVTSQVMPDFASCPSARFLRTLSASFRQGGGPRS
jgi:hypothetical protein